MILKEASGRFPNSWGPTDVVKFEPGSDNSTKDMHLDRTGPGSVVIFRQNMVSEQADLTGFHIFRC